MTSAGTWNSCDWLNASMRPPRTSAPWRSQATIGVGGAGPDPVGGGFGDQSAAVSPAAATQLGHGAGLEHLAGGDGDARPGGPG